MANIASLRHEVAQHHICEANASYRRRRCIIYAPFVRFLNDVCLRQMMLAPPMMFASRMMFAFGK